MNPTIGGAVNEYKVINLPNGTQVNEEFASPDVKAQAASGAYKTEVKTLNLQPSNTNPSYISSSAPVVASENRTRSDASALSATLPGVDTTGITTASQRIQDSLQSYMDQLEARRSSQVDQINKGFDETKRQTEGAQAKETGSTTVGIARMGGYLGGSGSGTGVMLNLAQTHRNELTALEGKRQSAIQEANNAINDKQFQLASLKVKEAKDLESEIYNRNKDFWNRQLQLQQEDRAQDTFLQTKAKNTLDIISTTGVATPEAIAEIDGLYGAGTGKKYVEIVNADKQAKSTKAMYDNFKAKIDLLESIPAGVQIKFGDETITGIGRTSDIETFHVEDAKGNVTLVTHNKATGTFNTQSLGAIGTPSSTATVEPQKISSMTSELSAVADPATGYVSPTDYKNGLKAWLSTGSSLKSYEDNFKTFADPAKKDQYDFSEYYGKSGDDILKIIQGLK